MIKKFMAMMTWKVLQMLNLQMATMITFLLKVQNDSEDKISESDDSD